MFISKAGPHAPAMHEVEYQFLGLLSLAISGFIFLAVRSMRDTPWIRLVGAPKMTSRDLKSPSCREI